LNARPSGLPPVTFHLRHIARSLNRLMTYAEGRQLSDHQLALLTTELDAGGKAEQLFKEVRSALDDTAKRVLAVNPTSFAEQRVVGKKRLPTTVAGLLIHIADHTQRHVGQAITTAKLLRSTEKR
jgi:hypothetical protein